MSDWNGIKKYYSVMEEWNFPNGDSGSSHIENFSSVDKALEVCKKMCEYEVPHFAFATNCDCLPPEEVLDSPAGKAIGYCLTSKLGLDDWFYFAKVVEVQFGLPRKGD